MTGRKRPFVFGIGLPHSGGDVLAAQFRANGYGWRHHNNGQMAKDIAYSTAMGVKPLSRWAHVAGFSDIFCFHKRQLPPLKVQDVLPLLQDAFPDAYFIHTHRDPADWVAARFWAEGGAHRTACAWHAQITEDALPSYWLDEHARHVEDCTRRFAGNPRFLDINIASEPLDIVSEFVSEHYDLVDDGDVPDLTVTPDAIRKVVTHIESLPEPQAPAPPDLKFIRQVSVFCMNTGKSAGKIDALSETGVTWGLNNAVVTRDDIPAPLAHDGTQFTLSSDFSVFERTQATLNELQTCGARAPLNIDMMDARHMGSTGHRHPPPRTIVYNRRAGAANLTLWPLPGYHTLAPTGSVGGYPVDPIPFDQKADKCVWRGNMTGRMMPQIAPDDRTLEGVFKIRKRMEVAQPDWAKIKADLACVPRYNVVQTYKSHPDFDVAFAMVAKWKDFATTPVFDGLCGPKQDRAWFHKFKYVLSLSGNDTGSNFLSAAASNSLILKEEDGWEVFYSCLFMPWTHYIPLAIGATDVEEKLTWARANPNACADMVAASTRVFDLLANPHNLDGIKRAIAARLNASR